MKTQFHSKVVYVKDVPSGATFVKHFEDYLVRFIKLAVPPEQDELVCVTIGPHFPDIPLPFHQKLDDNDLVLLDEDIEFAPIDWADGKELVGTTHFSKAGEVRVTLKNSILLCVKAGQMSSEKYLLNVGTGGISGERQFVTGYSGYRLISKDIFGKKFIIFDSSKIES